MRILSKTVQLAVVALLGVPALVGLRAPADPGTENRALAPFPARPATLADALGYTARLDAWINDHVGLRARMVMVNNWLRYHVARQFPTEQVVQGKHGRIFLGAHQPTGQQYAAVLVPCGAQPRDLDPLAAGRQLTHFLQAYRGLGIDPRMLVVPSGPVVDHELLPDWLQRRCAAATPALAQLPSWPGISADARAHLWDSYPEVMALKARGHSFFPKTWFHWNGEGVGQVAALSQQKLWGRAPAPAPFATRRVQLPSDIGHLFPGVNLPSMVDLPQLDAAGASLCQGPDCFAGTPFAAVAQKLSDVSLMRNPAPGLRPRLVLLSDSFGRFIAPWYARYYREVVHMSTNNANILTPQEKAALRAYAFRPNSDDEVLFLYHDGDFLAGRSERDLAELLP